MTLCGDTTLSDQESYLECAAHQAADVIFNSKVHYKNYGRLIELIPSKLIRLAKCRVSVIKSERNELMDIIEEMVELSENGK